MCPLPCVDKYEPNMMPCVLSQCKATCTFDNPVSLVILFPCPNTRLFKGKKLNNQVTVSSFLVIHPLPNRIAWSLTGCPTSNYCSIGEIFNYPPFWWKLMILNPPFSLVNTILSISAKTIIANKKTIPKKINKNLTKKDRLELITNLHISCMMFAFYHTLLEKQFFPIEEKRKHLGDLKQEIKSSQGH